MNTVTSFAPAPTLRLELGPGVHVHVFGNARWAQNVPFCERAAERLLGKPAGKALRLHRPEHGSGGAWRVAQPLVPRSEEHAAGGVLTSCRPSFGIALAHDEHFLVLSDPDRRYVAFATIAPAALASYTPTRNGGIVARLVSAVTGGTEPEHVTAFIGGGISRFEASPTLLRAMQRGYPDLVDQHGRTNGALVVQRQLEAWGVRRNKILVWDSCSYSNPMLGSAYAVAHGYKDREFQNVLIVTKR